MLMKTPVVRTLFSEWEMKRSADGAQAALVGQLAKRLDLDLGDARQRAFDRVFEGDDA